MFIMVLALALFSGEAVSAPHASAAASAPVAIKRGSLLIPTLDM